MGIPRATYYYWVNQPDKPNVDEYEDEIIKVFNDSKGIYGTRKIKAQLSRIGINISRRRIGRVMKKNALVSVYTVKQYKVYSSDTNRQNIPNKVNQEFDNDTLNDIIVSDLTYINVGGIWHYICILIDLFNREIVGYSSGYKKDARLVKEAFLNSNIVLSNIRVFHTDRGREFDNELIDEILKAFGIKRSLSKAGYPYDNAVAEATFKIFKTEFCNKRYDSLNQLKLELFEYVNWYNKYRLHGSLGYASPVEFRNNIVYANNV